MKPHQVVKEQLKEFVEQGANLEHDRWARWQKHLHSKMTRLSCSPNYMSLPIELFNRWERQIQTLYSELSEQEKESDRKETRNYLPLLHSSLLAVLESVEDRVENQKIRNTAHKEVQERRIIYNTALSDIRTFLTNEINKIKELQ